MKQLLIISGKGGTGKTTLASALIKLSNAKASADCDVDAPNLHLIIAHGAEAPVTSDYYGMPQAEIDMNLCSRCGNCKNVCRFEAISCDNGVYTVDPFACEGCSLCAVLCAERAITMKPAISGVLSLYKKNDSTFSTAQLEIGRGNSGKLVTEVKKRLKENVPVDTELAIIDGPPGLGCPVIASLNGADLVLIVAEPSVAGLSDMERVISTARLFGTQIAVCVNKSDMNLGLTQYIKSYCDKNNLVFVGEMPFDNEAVKAVNDGLSIVDVDCRAGNAAREIYQRVISLI